jgi:hypothetical protein
MLTTTRRETLFGAAGAATVAALPQTVLAAPVGPRRLSIRLNERYRTGET